MVAVEMTGGVCCRATKPQLWVGHSQVRLLYAVLIRLARDVVSVCGLTRIEHHSMFPLVATSYYYDKHVATYTNSWFLHVVTTYGNFINFRSPSYKPDKSSLSMMRLCNPSATTCS